MAASQRPPMTLPGPRYTRHVDSGSNTPQGDGRSGQAAAARSKHSHSKPASASLSPLVTFRTAGEERAFQAFLRRTARAPAVRLLLVGNVLAVAVLLVVDAATGEAAHWPLVLAVAVAAVWAVAVGRPVQSWMWGPVAECGYASLYLAVLTVGLLLQPPGDSVPAHHATAGAVVPLAVVVLLVAAADVRLFVSAAAVVVVCMVVIVAGVDPVHHEAAVAVALLSTVSCLAGLLAACVESRRSRLRWRLRQSLASENQLLLRSYSKAALSGRHSAAATHGGGNTMSPSTVVPMPSPYGTVQGTPTSGVHGGTVSTSGHRHRFPSHERSVTDGGTQWHMGTPPQRPPTSMGTPPMPRTSSSLPPHSGGACVCGTTAAAAGASAPRGDASDTDHARPPLKHASPRGAAPVAASPGDGGGGGGGGGDGGGTSPHSGGTATGRDIVKRIFAISDLASDTNLDAFMAVDPAAAETSLRTLVSAPAGRGAGAKAGSHRTRRSGDGGGGDGGGGGGGGTALPPSSRPFGASPRARTAPQQPVVVFQHRTTVLPAAPVQRQQTPTPTAASCTSPDAPAAAAATARSTSSAAEGGSASSHRRSGRSVSSADVYHAPGCPMHQPPAHAAAQGDAVNTHGLTMGSGVGAVAIPPAALPQLQQRFAGWTPPPHARNHTTGDPRQEVAVHVADSAAPPHTTVTAADSGAPVPVGTCVSALQDALDQLQDSNPSNATALITRTIAMLRIPMTTVPPISVRVPPPAAGAATPPLAYDVVNQTQPFAQDHYRYDTAMMQQRTVALQRVSSPITAARKRRHGAMGCSVEAAESGEHAGVAATDGHTTTVSPTEADHTVDAGAGSPTPVLPSASSPDGGPPMHPPLHHPGGSHLQGLQPRSDRTETAWSVTGTAAGMDPLLVEWVQDILGTRHVSRAPSMLRSHTGGDDDSRRSAASLLAGVAGPRQSYGSVVNRPRRQRLESDVSGPSTADGDAVYGGFVTACTEAVRRSLVWTFDVRELVQVSSGRSLELLGLHVLFHFDIPRQLGIRPAAFQRYLSVVERTYCYKPEEPNPYHSAMHGADVLQAVSVLMTHLSPRVGDHLSVLDQFALVFAAIIHDYRHTGTNNNFLVGRGDEMALRYNDQSVLENFSVAEAFRLMYDSKMFPGLMGLATLSNADFTYFRKTVVSCVLATDLSIRVDFSPLMSAPGVSAAAAAAAAVAPPAVRQTSSAMDTRLDMPGGSLPPAARPTRPMSGSMLPVRSGSGAGAGAGAGAGGSVRRNSSSLRSPRTAALSPASSGLAGASQHVASSRMRASGSMRDVDTEFGDGDGDGDGVSAAGDNDADHTGDKGAPTVDTTPPAARTPSPCSSADHGRVAPAPARDPLLSEQQRLCLAKLLLKVGDVSHPMRPLATHLRWFDALSVEFSNQGRKELKLSLPVSPLCDPHVVNVAPAQLGFINFVVQPICEVLQRYHPGFDWLSDNLRSNYRFWEEQNQVFKDGRRPGITTPAQAVADAIAAGQDPKRGVPTGVYPDVLGQEVGGGVQLSDEDVRHVGSEGDASLSESDLDDVHSLHEGSNRAPR